LDSCDVTLTETSEAKRKCRTRCLKKKHSYLRDFKKQKPFLDKLINPVQISFNVCIIQKGSHAVT